MIWQVWSGWWGGKEGDGKHDSVGEQLSYGGREDSSIWVRGLVAHHQHLDQLGSYTAKKRTKSHHNAAHRGYNVLDHDLGSA